MHFCKSTMITFDNVALQYALTMRRWISQNNIRLPRGAFLYLPYFSSTLYV
nr:hypothetical protein HRS07_23330 [Escherichia coli]